MELNLITDILVLRFGTKYYFQHRTLKGTYTQKVYGLSIFDGFIGVVIWGKENE